MLNNATVFSRGALAVCYSLTSFFFNLFIYLFLVVLGLRGCVDFSLVSASRGYSLVVVHSLPIALASLVAEHRI